MYFRKRRQSSSTCVSMIEAEPWGESPSAKMLSNALNAAARRAPPLEASINTPVSENDRRHGKGRPARSLVRPGLEAEVAGPV